MSIIENVTCIEIAKLTWLQTDPKNPARGQSSHCRNGSYEKFSPWKFRLVYILSRLDRIHHREDER